MNDDTNLHPWIEPELEARLTALVLGEASDFERDELERLVTDRPELGLYQKRLEAMHRMLREVAKGENAEEQGEWKLSPERRTAVLARLRGEEKAEEKVVVMPRSKRRVPWGMMIRIAACAAVIALFLGLMFPATTGALRKAERPNDGGSAFAYIDSGETSASRHWYFREESRDSGAPELAVTGGTVATDPSPERFVGAISGAGAIAADEFSNGRAFGGGAMATEAPATPSLALSEEKEDGLTDLAIRTPVTATGTTAPAAEPPPGNRFGRTDVANGTVALGSGGVTLNGGIEGYSTAGRRVEGESSSLGMDGANTYTGGLVINSGGVLVVASPEPAAAPPAPPAPVDVSKGYALADTMTRGTTATTDGDDDGLERLGLADSRAGEKAKTQLGPELVEEERMRSLEPLSETTGTLAQDLPDASSRKFSEKEVAELAQVRRAFPDARETLRKAGQADDFGTVNVGQTGAAVTPAPAPATKPMPVAAATASGPAVAGEPVAEQPLTKVGAGTLAMNGGFTGVGGFVDVEGKKEAASNRPASSANLNYTGDTQVHAGVDAKGNVAMNGWADAAGAAVDRKNVDAYDFVTPVETGRLSRVDKEVAKEAGDAPLRGVVMEKSMEESLVRGGEVVAVERKRLAENESKGELQKNGVSANAISSFSTSSVDVPLLGNSKSVPMSVMDPMNDGPTMRMGGFEDAGSAADKSVADIMALTPQLNFQTSAGGLAWEDSNGENLSTLYASTETEGRVRMASGSDRLEHSDKRRKMLEEVSATWESPAPAALDETSPSAEPFSTFSLHVSDVSFQLAKSSLASGKWPEAEKIRIEEFVNAFDYGDPVPSMGERVACRIDQGAHPFLQQRNLVRIALRTAEAGRSSGTALRLTLLLDSSGSMERPDRRATLTRAVATLAGLLGENDRITLVSFARQPRLVADAVAGNEAMKLAETVASLPSEGGTNLEAALELAFEKAREHQEANAQNRIVLLTDGAANLGDAKAESLGARVEMMRDAGIAFDAAGFGAEGLNDEILEALTRKGDGRYYLLDRPEDAGEAFAEQIAGALRPAAKNVKVQVEFNPDRVKSYKLLGFEKHRLATEDFRNDAVDAAELAAAEAGVAVYQVEPDPAGEGDLGSVSVRFRDLESGEMIERRWSLPHLAAAPAPEQGGGAILLATVASQFAAKLAGGPLGDVVDLGELARLAATLPDSPRVNELRTMIEQARGLEGDR
jgi:Mg-chelatase subunit ChlD